MFCSLAAVIWLRVETRYILLSLSYHHSVFLSLASIQLSQCRLTDTVHRESTDLCFLAEVRNSSIYVVLPISTTGGGTSDVTNNSQSE
jgi:hypothetical protein